MPSPRSTAAASASRARLAAAAADAASAARRCASRTRPRSASTSARALPSAAQRALVRGARGGGGGLGLGERGLGRRQLGRACARRRWPSCVATLGALRALRVRCAASAASACAARRVSSAAARRAASAASPLSRGARGRRRELGLVDRRERGLGGAQALGGLDRARSACTRERAASASSALGALALARGLGGDLGEALGQRLAARAEALEAVASAMPCAAARLLLAEDAASSPSAAARRAVISASARRGGVALARARRRARSRARRGRGASRPSAEASRRRRSSAICAPEHLGALGGGRLQLERAQARAHLALDVARALEVGARRARACASRALAAALELAEPGGLLDRAPRRSSGRASSTSSTRALRDDAVQLAAEPGVGQRLLHVEAAHGLAVEQVLAVARRGAAGA